MTFLEHLGELRRRIIYSLVAFVVAFLGCNFITEKLLYWAILPLQRQMPEGTKLIGTGIVEAFSAQMSVAGIGALIISSPFIFYQLWCFISPGLYSKEKRLVIPFVVFATLFFLSGVAFGYFIVFPVGFRFFMDQYKDVNLNPQIRISQYLSFIISLLLSFGLCFELPVVAYFLGKIGLISWRIMVKVSKYVIVIIFIVAAILTPTPDVANQLLLAVPLLLLYGLSILIVALTGKPKPAAIIPAEKPPDPPADH